MVEGLPGAYRVAMLDPEDRDPYAISGYQFGRHQRSLSKLTLARFRSDATWALGANYTWVAEPWRPATQEELAKHQLEGLEGL